MITKIILYGDRKIRYKKLGKTGIDVSIIGLGAEYLEHAPLDITSSVVDEVVDKLDPEKLSWAMEQVDNTLAKKK